MARLSNLTERGLDTQRDLSEALVELSLEKGYTEVTIKDITDRLGVDRTTFYLHFKDKDELVLATQRRLFDELSAHFGDGTDPASGFMAFYERIGSDRHAWKAMLMFDEYPRFSGRFDEYVASRLAALPSGLAAAGNNPRLPGSLAARFIAATVRSCALWWLDQDEPCPPADIAGMTKDLLLKGLSIPRA
jgi:AcrR family transcriptional regulator